MHSQYSARNSAAEKLVTNSSQWRKMERRGEEEMIGSVEPAHCITRRKFRAAVSFELSALKDERSGAVVSAYQVLLYQKLTSPRAKGVEKEENPLWAVHAPGHTGARACEQQKSKWSPTPVDTCNPKGVNDALLTSEVEIGHNFTLCFRHKIRIETFSYPFSSFKDISNEDSSSYVSTYRCLKTPYAEDSQRQGTRLGRSRSRDDMFGHRRGRRLERIGAHDYGRAVGAETRAGETAETFARNTEQYPSRTLSITTLREEFA
ncbi:hypothetical protein EVAR_68564_1 [Eumeta japonica]|uniref:Uncharacterized protein n=1 Tax=Eumeta variegata TaxID=151549 RepID=A0A4C1SAI3_EUMVA|nr:hypothetical protein EVAR_68564_1 [Eumeta japonica]